MPLEDLTPSNRFELALSGDMTAEEASNRIEKILAGADIEPADRLEYFLKLRVSEGGGGGGVPATMAAHYTLIPTEDYTLQHRVEVQLVPVEGYVIVVFATGPVTKPESGYTFICGEGSSLATKDGHILRADGTIGTDNNFYDYNPETGLAKFGGQYGVFHTGVQYEIYLFSGPTVAS